MLLLRQSDQLRKGILFLRLDRRGKAQQRADAERQPQQGSDRARRGQGLIIA
jgi:hypothetical protein